MREAIETMASQSTLREWTAEGSPALTEVIIAVGTACARIAAEIRVAGLAGAYGAAGATNVQGEQQQKLDVFANDVLTTALRECVAVAGVVSEEDDEPVSFERPDAPYVLSFDPLDGSSNIDVNVNTGTIFGVRERAARDESLEAAVLEPGSRQVAAGYVVYGPATIFVLTDGHRVDAFTLSAEGEFVRSAERMQMPEQGPYYSANEANAASWPAGYREYLKALLAGELGGKAYSARYIGSLVADFHRTLLKGGVFLYPPTEKAAGGKLRLQYEANPLAMIAAAAGGLATNGRVPILELVPKSIHERTPLVVGSRREVEALQRRLAELD